MVVMGMGLVLATSIDPKELGEAAREELLQVRFAQGMSGLLQKILALSGEVDPERTQRSTADSANCQ